MPRIIPNLWFDGRAHEAATFYCSLFPNSKITGVSHYPEAAPGPTGEVMTVDFVLDGQPFTGINGGDAFTFDEAVSLLVECKDQAEVDHYWDALVADGGEESMCGWCKDRFGLSWQVVPVGMQELFEHDDPAVAERAMQAMLQMRRLDLAELRAAAERAP